MGNLWPAETTVQHTKPTQHNNIIHNNKTIQLKQKDIYNLDEEKWENWQTKNLFDHEFCTTAIIQWRISQKKYNANVTTDPNYFQKLYPQDTFGYSDDEDIDNEPEKVQLVLTEYEYHRINIKITPQIGNTAGIAQIYTFVKPKTFINNATNNKDSNYWYDDPVPTLNTLIKRALSHVHTNDFDNIISISDFNQSYIAIPFALNDNLFLRLFETDNIPKILANIIRKYLGITQVIINFIPNNIFEPLVIDIIPGLTMKEFKWLIVISLFVKYRNQNINSVPQFIWIYNENGIYKNDTDSYNAKVTQNEYLLLFSSIKTDNYGLKRHMSALRNCVILNIVGHGFKTVYFENFKSIKFKDLVDEFYKFTNRNYDVNTKEIIAIYPFGLDRLKRNELDIFYPNTHDHFSEVSNKMKVYPLKQNKLFVTFDYERYKKILNWSLYDLNINKNGCLIEMFCITGPCIKLMFCSMVGDQRIMDVNFDWSLDVFKMYATKLQDRKFNSNCFYKIEGCSNDAKTLYDICKDFNINDYYNYNMVRLRG
eukprot:437261_1